MTVQVELEDTIRRPIYWALLLYVIGFCVTASNHTIGATTYYLAAHGILTAAILPARHCKLRTLLCIGIVLRIAAASIPAFTSNDIYRYLWDGAVANMGIDPYRTAPAMISVTTGFPLPPDHQSLTTLYPPASLLLFQLCALTSPDNAYWIWKGICCLSSLVSLGLLYRMIDDSSQVSHSLLALSPLLIFESCIGAHLDGIASMCICSAFYAQQRKRPLMSGLSLGLAIGIKTSYLILLPVFGIVWLQKKVLQKSILGFFLIILLLSCYCLFMGFIPLGSLLHVMQHWSFGSPLYSLAEYANMAQYGRSLFFLALIAIPVLLSMSKKLSLSRKLLYAASLTFILSPVCYPWYLLLPALVLSLSWSPILFLWLTLLPLTYEVIIPYKEYGIWEPANYPLWIIIVGWFLGAYYEYRLYLQRKSGEVAVRVQPY